MITVKPKIVTIHQPDFIPWLGFFDRWQQSDLLIILDNVQFLRRGWHHRDKIKTRNGVKWLTVPVIKKGKFNQTINKAKIDNTINWKKKHLNLIKDSYGKSSQFNPVYHKITDIYSEKYDLLIDFNITLLNFFANKLTIKVPFAFASSFKTNSNGTQRLVDLIAAAGGDTYLTGLGSKEYIDKTIFQKNSIKLVWQNFKHPVYAQRFGDFESNLSILDLFFNLEPNQIKNILTKKTCNLNQENS